MHTQLPLSVIPPVLFYLTGMLAFYVTRKEKERFCGEQCGFPFPCLYFI